ncbi:sigma-54-dependent Fis family transcriptional regulator [Aquisalimonas asiatica]|uniref:Transcriptional regulator of acetoin/glycerol metabolism n=1 Tax=Aquisalimonas asiatica TaxID=406100 RepID=A0A1H8TH64_9GAMM|nr:sigma-54-dependent Fis family transcriptional regulator [Aquisalimonas asiatica]SEO90469.1 Transcriptional regulator of acetoin/glycerol metabolism [Aquisalimonas asiatica]
MGLRREQREHIDAVLKYAEGRGSPVAQAPNTLVIGQSWQRCITEYGLDPTRPRPARIVTNQVLREHQDRSDELLGVARAGVDQLYQQAAQLDYVLLLTDDRGIAVQYLGDRHRDARLRKAGLYLGSDWSEDYAGTCAVGTCLQGNVSLSCHRTDHFDATHIGLTCTAAPIRDPDGRPLAVLNISALDSPIGPESQTFGHHLVTLYARMIEDAYFLRRYRNSYLLRCDTSREFVRVSGRYLIALEEDGTILAANTAGRELIAGGGPAGAGATAITAVLDCELRDLWDLPYRSEDQIRAFRTRRSSEVYFATLIQPSRSLPRSRTNGPGMAEEDVPALDQLAADDPAMRKTLAMAKRLRNEPINVLVTGETGTGKERLARALHDSSARANGAFVALNCAAIPESLIESELFGYQGGSFTGARQKGRAGLVQQAHGGTLFLDEIGDMPLHLQTRLLRVLAEREIQPLGTERPVPVDLRVVAATHQDLRRLIASGAFREDLYYRLNGATLWLPPLRERADQQHVIDSVYADLTRNRPHAPRLRADAVSALLANPWPGNIRQLINALAFALATAPGDEITAGDLPDEHPPASLASRGPGVHRPQAGSYTGDAAILHEALMRTHWNITAVARELGLSRPTIYRRMRRHGMVPPNWRDGEEAGSG